MIAKHHLPCLRGTHAFSVFPGAAAAGGGAGRPAGPRAGLTAAAAAGTEQPDRTQPGLCQLEVDSESRLTSPGAVWQPRPSGSESVSRCSGCRGHRPRQACHWHAGAGLGHHDCSFAASHDDDVWAVLSQGRGSIIMIMMAMLCKVSFQSDIRAFS